MVLSGLSLLIEQPVYSADIGASSVIPIDTNKYKITIDNEQVLVGSSRTAFKPDITLYRFGDEAWMKLGEPIINGMELTSKDTYSNISNDKVVWNSQGVEFNIYAKNETDILPKSLEYELIIDDKYAGTSKPIESIIFPLSSSGLKFYYQPTFSDEWYARNGMVAPDYIKGTYAVYYNKSGDYTRLGGKNYKTGKAFHIFKPELIDAKGNRIYADLHISDGYMVIDLRGVQDWLSKAVYPVIIDPTIGYTSIGAAGCLINADDALAMTVQTPAAGSIEAIGMTGSFGQLLTDTNNIKMAIWNYADGGAVQGVTPEVTAEQSLPSFPATTWQSANFSAPVSLSSSTNYSIGATTNSTFMGVATTFVSADCLFYGANLTLTGDGDINGTWTKSAGATYYELVDELYGEEDTADYVTGTTNGGGYLYFTFDHSQLPADAVNCWVQGGYYYKNVVAGTANMYVGFKVNGTRYQSTIGGNIASTVWDTEYSSYPVNPDTAAMWTASDIKGTSGNPLQQFGLVSTDLDPDVSVASVYAQVFYDDPDEIGQFRFDTSNNFTTPAVLDWDTITALNEWLFGGSLLYGYLSIYMEYTASSTPTVTTQAASSIEATTATGNANITNLGGEDVTTRGIQWGVVSGVYTTNVTESGNFTTGAFTESLVGLPEGTTIYCRGEAYNMNGWGYGSEVSFLTKPAAPTNVAATDGVHTDKVVITWTKSTGATAYQVYRDGAGLGWLGDVATYDDTGADAPVITAGTASASDGTSNTTVTLSLAGEGVANGTTHTYKVRAKNATGESADSATDTGYVGHGALTYQWMRSAADSDAAYSNIAGATTDPYNDVGGVTAPDGRYYKCTLSATGAASANSTSDRGWMLGVPSVTTVAASGVGSTLADMNGNITSLGGDVSCTERGVAYGTTSKTIVGNPAPSASGYDAWITESGIYGTGAFSESSTNLTQITTYYFRAWAKNSFGYGWGLELSFTTGGTVMWFEPNSMILTTNLPERAIGNNATITWGSLPSGVSVAIGSMTSGDQPAPNVDPFPATVDILPDIEPSDWFVNPDISGTLAGNPLSPFVSTIASITTLNEITWWRIFGLAFVLFVTVATVLAVRGHLLVAGIAGGVAWGIVCYYTIFPLWCIFFSILAVIAGIVAERKPSV